MSPAIVLTVTAGLAEPTELIERSLAEMTETLAAEPTELACSSLAEMSVRVGLACPTVAPGSSSAVVLTATERLAKPAEVSASGTGEVTASEGLALPLAEGARLTGVLRAAVAELSPIVGPSESCGFRISLATMKSS